MAIQGWTSQFMHGGPSLGPHTMRITRQMLEDLPPAEFLRLEQEWECVYFDRPTDTFVLERRRNKMGQTGLQGMLGQQLGQQAWGYGALAQGFISGQQSQYRPQGKLPVRRTNKPLVGVRHWALTHDFKLRSSFVEHVWEGPILRADSAPKDYVRVGDKTDNCHGIYAWLPGMPIDEGLATLYNSIGRVEGTVQFLGRVVRHDRGYRAERVRIDSLCIVQLKPHYDRKEVMKALEDRYQCEVRFFADLMGLYLRIKNGD